MVVAGLSQTPTGGGHDALGPAGGRGGVRAGTAGVRSQELRPVLRSATPSAARLKCLCLATAKANSN